MTDLRTAAQQALEALESAVEYDYHGTPLTETHAGFNDAATALRAALAKPPVDDPHRDHWVAIAEAAQKIAASTECGLAEAKALCAALDRLTDAALAEPCPCGDRSAAQCPGAWTGGKRMNKEDIIRMARQADEGFETDTFHEESLVGMDAIERFAHLVYEATFRDANIAASRTILDAAVLAEREACAKVCDLMEQQAEGTECCKWPTPIDCAAAIRARSNP